MACFVRIHVFHGSEKSWARYMFIFASMHILCLRADITCVSLKMYRKALRPMHMLIKWKYSVPHEFLYIHIIGSTTEPTLYICVFLHCTVCNLYTLILMTTFNLVLLTCIMYHTTVSLVQCVKFKTKLVYMYTNGSVLCPILI